MTPDLCDCVNCCNCGASIDLQSNSICPYCHSAISMLDMKQQQQMLAQLKEAAEPRPVDLTLPLKLAQAKAETSALFRADDTEWWEDARSGDLVQAVETAPPAPLSAPVADDRPAAGLVDDGGV